MRRTSFGGEAGIADAAAGSPVAAADAAAEHNNKNTNANNPAASSVVSSVVSSVDGEMITDFILTELKMSGREIHLSFSFSAHHSMCRTTTA